MTVLPPGFDARPATLFPGPACWAVSALCAPPHPPAGTFSPPGRRGQRERPSFSFGVSVCLQTEASDLPLFSRFAGSPVTLPATPGCSAAFALRAPPHPPAGTFSPLGRRGLEERLSFSFGVSVGLQTKASDLPLLSRFAGSPATLLVAPARSAASAFRAPPHLSCRTSSPRRGEEEGRMPLSGDRQRRFGGVKAVPLFSFSPAGRGCRQADEEAFPPAILSAPPKQSSSRSVRKLPS